MHRRGLLAGLVVAGGAVVSGIVAIPAFLAALSPAIKSRKREAWRSVGLLEDFPNDEVVEAVIPVNRSDWSRSLEAKSVYVWRREQDEPIVFSRNCTDLSCPVHFDVGSECFFCPCHGGIFAKDGSPMAGPPKKPLYRYTTRIQDGELEIDLLSLPLMT